MKIKLSEAINVLLHHKEAFEISGKTAEAIDFAIVALGKQKQEINKSCKTCKHRNLSGTELPCFVCYMASDEVKDYYEPYTEEES